MELLRPIRSRRPRLKSVWACSVMTLSVTFLTIFMIASMLHSFTNRHCDTKGCDMSSMYPTYAPLKNFDTEHTPFASKYKLYLYREKYLDTKLEPKGVPVLFIPGNAGSYKQVRPIAARAAELFYDMLKKDNSILEKGARNLDFFTVDFNEDITAFHGQTLLDQAEYLNDAVAYILSLYHDARKSTTDADLPDPSSVIILGHSMGGIVARTMLTRPNYQANTVNTIITLSAPHARAPVSFDKQIVETYQHINDYWRKAYLAKWANNNPLWHVTLISIAGGGLDTVVPSDYASISSLVPETHGFTVFTSSIPNVWLGADHLAILWCAQLRDVVARAMLDVVDVRRAGQTKPRAERMRYFRKRFLTGLESSAERSLSSNEPTTLLTLEENSHSVVTLGQRLVLKQLGEKNKQHSYLIPVPPSQSAGSTKFTLLTDRDLRNPDDKIEVLFCSVYPLQPGQAAQMLTMKMSGDSTGSTRLACKNAADDVIALPASKKDSKHSFDKKAPFSFLSYDLEELSEHQFVAVVDKAEGRSQGWLIAEFADKRQSSSVSNVGLIGLLMGGVEMQINPEGPFVQSLTVPNIHSSLLAYTLDVDVKACKSGEPLFQPLLRQYLEDPHESKFFVNVRHADINLHGSAPFMPPSLQGGGQKGLSLQFWVDPTCAAPVEITLKFDFIGSLGRLVMRYRTIFAAFPLFVVALVIRKQFNHFNAGGHFMSFSEGLDLVISKSLPRILALYALTAAILAFWTAAESKTIPSPLASGATTPSNTPPNYTKNDLLIGMQDPFFWFLAPLFALLSVGTCILVNYGVVIVLNVLTLAYMFVSNSIARFTGDNGTNYTPAFTSNSPKRRVLTTLVLLIFVATLIPFQFAYMVACIVQLATTFRALRFARESRSSTHWDFYHYTHSIFILMLWILPINLPVLVVWIHNLAVHWLTPFSSHHNVLSIMPFILLVETLTTGKMVPRIETGFRRITSALLIMLATFAAVYGVTYAYLLHQAVNIFAAWLVAVHFSTLNWSKQHIMELLNDDDDSSRSKKRP
ncbi:PGAP1-domain-containing protein [Ascobolus immersus RN42]|uniref:GPI inositol-deacylase n=1 Tax=Ascobolus immersus RN42 TaxID=1160509 RepID=A0A3N4IUW5_ASCIM|nr:PGAP1-domain-containing protein [Ascobolus immersus RN42]